MPCLIKNLAMSRRRAILGFQAALGDKKRKRKSSRVLPDSCQMAVLGMGSAVWKRRKALICSDVAA